MDNDSRIRISRVVEVRTMRTRQWRIRSQIALVAVLALAMGLMIRLDWLTIAVTWYVLFLAVLAILLCGPVVAIVGVVVLDLALCIAVKPNIPPGPWGLLLVNARRRLPGAWAS